MWHQPNWNDSSRYDLIRAIVEKGTVSIDEFSTNTGDRSIFRGHYYSDKAPGVAFAGVPVYWIANQLVHFMGWDRSKEDRYIYIFLRFKLWVVLVIIIAFPSSLLGVLLFEFLTRIQISERFSLWLTLGYSLGTIVFPYSTLFYGHQFAGVCIFSAFYIINRRFTDSPIHPFLFLWIAGFVSGYAVITEYPVILLLPIVTGYLWLKEKNFKSLGVFILGMAIPALILLYYNYLCSGKLFNVGYFHEDMNRFNYEMGRGIAGVTYPTLPALWGITFSLFRGLFPINPFLLFAIPGYFYMYRQPVWRKEFWVSLLSVILFFLFNSSYYMWWGGWALGPRHVIPILPFLVLPIAFLPRKYWKYVCVFIALSIVFMWVGVVVNPQIPESQHNPLFGYAVHQFIQGIFSQNLGKLIMITYVPVYAPACGDDGIYLMGIIMIFWIWFLIRKTPKESLQST